MPLVASSRLIAVCLVCLGISTASTVSAQEGAKRDEPGVIILELVTQEEGKTRSKSKPEQKEESDDDRKKMNDEDDEGKNKDDRDDDKDKVKKKKQKKSKQKKERKQPKAKREVRPEHDRGDERPREPQLREEEMRRPDMPRRGPVGEQRREPQSFESRFPEKGPGAERRGQWEMQSRGDDRPREQGRPQAEERPREEPRRVGPPDRGPEESMRREMERQRQQMEAQSREMRTQLEQTRRELEERARREAGGSQERQQIERRGQEMAQRLDQMQRQLEERNREIEKLRGALEQRERAIVELKQALAKQAAGGKGGSKPVDASLEARIERMELEIKKVMGTLKQAEMRGDRKMPEPRKEALPSVKEPAKPRAERSLNVAPPVAEVKPSGGALVLGNVRLKVDTTESANPLAASGTLTLELPVEPQPVPPSVVAPKVILDVKPQVIPPPPKPVDMLGTPGTPFSEPADAKASLGGVGIVEGDVAAVLDQENKIVLKVSSWNDGKQMRADWVGQQVAIVKGEMPAVKVGDHVSLDARIESSKGITWGGKVFSVTAGK